MSEITAWHSTKEKVKLDFLMLNPIKFLFSKFFRAPNMEQNPVRNKEKYPNCKAERFDMICFTLGNNSCWKSWIFKAEGSIFLFLTWNALALLYVKMRNEKVNEATSRWRIKRDHDVIIQWSIVTFSFSSLMSTASSDQAIFSPSIRKSALSRPPKSTSIKTSFFRRCSQKNFDFEISSPTSTLNRQKMDKKIKVHVRDNLSSLHSNPWRRLSHPPRHCWCF